MIRSLTRNKEGVGSLVGGAAAVNRVIRSETGGREGGGRVSQVGSHLTCMPSFVHKAVDMTGKSIQRKTV